MLSRNLVPLAATFGELLEALPGEGVGTTIRISLPLPTPPTP